jgi:hypothetical protein
MSSLARTAFALVAVGTLAGCASRTAPFDSLDEASVTILKLQGQEMAQTPMGPAAASPFPMLPIPGLTPEQQAQMQQGLGALGQQIQSALPPGLIPPGLIPAPGAAVPAPANAPRFNGFVILAQQPVMDDDMKDELLDLFGSEDSFSPNRGSCFYPGLGIVFQDPSMPPVELMVSFSCNQVMGNGFRWPYDVNGLTPESANTLRIVHERLFGPVPPQGA